MNKKELLEQLEGLPDDITILVARDEEWNQLSQLYAMEKVKAVTDMFEWNAVAEEDLKEYVEEEIINAVVLWG